MSKRFILESKMEKKNSNLWYHEYSTTILTLIITWAVVCYAGHQHTFFMSHAKPRQIIRLYTFMSYIIINIINVNKYDISSNFTNKSTQTATT